MANQLIHLKCFSHVFIKKSLVGTDIKVEKEAVFCLPGALSHCDLEVLCDGGGGLD